MSSTVTIAGFFEPLSSWIHLGGAFLAVGVARRLCQTGATPATRIALGLFAGSVIFALTMSGVYHATAPANGAREVMQRLDHAAIWILIAGTFTPVHVIMFRGPSRWAMLAVIWAFAVSGVILKTLFFASVPPPVGLSLYLAFGWMGTISAFMLARRFGRRAVGPLLLGGVLYSVGAAASVIEAPVVLPGYLGPHELFHLAVVAALYVHWRFIADLGGLLARGGRAPVALLDDPVAARA